MNTPSRFVLLSAVALSSFSVGLSLVAVACHAPARAESDPPVPTSAPAARVTAGPLGPARSTTPSARAEHAEARPAPSSAGADAAARVEVARLVVSADVLEREPVLGATLVAGRPVTAFVELRNADEPSSVLVTFERGAEAVGHVKLAVPARTSRYRTWATTTRVSTPGTWQAVVRAADGGELARASFEVSAPDATPAS